MEFRLLGPVEAWSGDQRLLIGPPQQRCVLAVLLMDANRVVPVDHLLDRLWGQRLPPSARDTLYSYLSRLRQAMAGHGVTVNRCPGGYLLGADPLTVDLHRFRDRVIRARASDDERALALFGEALGLWRGEPFAGLDSEWLEAVGTAVAQERLIAEMEHTDLRLRRGEHVRLLPELTARAAAHPVDERVAGQLMLACYRAGRLADALRHYQHIRRRLVAELGAEPGPDLQRLHQQILATDPVLASPGTPAPLAAPAPVAAATAVVPRQLPAPPGPFIGRRVELARLTEAVAPGAALVIITIGGAGGIGKTWLALHWAHQHAGWFPDGQLFVDLRGFTQAGQPMTPLTAVRGFLNGLGVDPGRIPTGLDAQAGLYRSLVAGKRMLIVLDNAADATQVTPLLPGSPACTVLITSRRYLPSLVTAHHARHIRLGVLTGTEARHLLQARLSAGRLAAEPQAAETLLACCGGFPLALGIIIGRALAHPQFPLSVLAAELTGTSSTPGALEVLDDTDAAASLPAVLSWSVRALTTEQARVFALLAVAPGPDISLPAAIALTALPEAQARAVLLELEQASLVQQHAPGRYRMHDLIRRYATSAAHQELAEEEREAALRRVLDFYTHTGHTAARLLYPHRQPIQLGPPARGVHPQPLTDVAAALVWLDTEHPALLAAQHTAARHAWHRIVFQLAWTLDTFLQRRGHFHDRLAAWRAALDAAAHLPGPAWRIQAQRRLGRAYFVLGCYEEGIGHLHQALALAVQHHDPGQQARAHRMLAVAWGRQGDDRRALDHATRALGLFRALGQPVWEADALNTVGWYAARLGQYDAARTHCQAALTVHRHRHHPEAEAATLDSLGYIAHHTGHHEQAIGYYRQALTVYRSIGNISDAATTLDHLGHPHIALHQHEQARTTWRQAMELYRAQGRTDDAERVLRQLATLTPPGE